MHADYLNENIASWIELQHCGIHYLVATVNQFKHEFDQYFTERKQKYHFESDSYI